MGIVLDTAPSERFESVRIKQPSTLILKIATVAVQVDLNRHLNLD